MTDNVEDSTTETTASTEDQIEILTTRIEKMKGLLTKAKLTINEYKRKADEAEERLEEEQRRAKDLQNRLDIALNRPPPAAHEVAGVQARVKSEGTVWMLVRKTGSELEWYREDLIRVVLPSLPEVVDCATSTPSVISAHISTFLKQHEDRVKKLQDANSQLESSLASLQKTYKELQQTAKDREMQLRGNGEMAHLISESKVLHTQLYALLEKDDVNPEALAPLQQAIIRFLQSPAKQNQDTENAKEHLSVLQKSLLDLARRLLYCRKELQTQENDWKSTCSALISEKDDLKSKLTQIQTDFAQFRDFSGQKIAEMTESNEKVLLEKTLEIEKLSKEVKKGVNLAYLRNVLVQYLTVRETDVGSM